MNNPLVDTYLGRLPWGDDELFEKVSSYIDQFVITPNIIKGITGQKLDVETLFNTDAMLKMSGLIKKYDMDRLFRNICTRNGLCSYRFSDRNRRILV